MKLRPSSATAASVVQSMSPSGEATKRRVLCSRFPAKSYPSKVTTPAGSSRRSVCPFSFNAGSVPYSARSVTISVAAAVSTSWRDGRCRTS